MSVMRLLRYLTLPCGCMVGVYRQISDHKEFVYVEEKGKTCAVASHRRNRDVPAAELTTK